jgi:hypothetical protein
VHTLHGRVQVLLGRGLASVESLCIERVLLFQQSQIALHIAQSLSQESELVVETSSRVIKGLVGYC